MRMPPQGEKSWFLVGDAVWVASGAMNGLEGGPVSFEVSKPHPKYSEYILFAAHL